jgi:hypothetical protein
MKLVYYLSLIFILLVTSPSLLASVPVSIDTDGDGIEDSQDADDDGDNPEFAADDKAPVNLGEPLDADAVLDDFSQREEVHNIGPDLDVDYAYRDEASELEAPVNIGPDIDVPEGY